MTRVTTAAIILLLFHMCGRTPSPDKSRHRRFEVTLRFSGKRVHQAAQLEGKTHRKEEQQPPDSHRPAVGDSPLVQVDVHLSPRFIQENL